MSMQPSANFHHLSGKKISLLNLNPSLLLWCVPWGPTQLRDMGTKQWSGQLGLVPLLGLFVLPTCQLPGFLEQLLHLPFGALGNV